MTQRAIRQTITIAAGATPAEKTSAAFYAHAGALSVVLAVASPIAGTVYVEGTDAADNWMVIDSFAAVASGASPPDVAVRANIPPFGKLRARFDPTGVVASDTVITFNWLNVGAQANL